MSIRKGTIIKNLKEKLGLNYKQSVSIMDTILDILTSELAEGEDVMISGFGKFCIKDKPKRQGRNPATGKTIMLRPRKVVTFKYSKKLNDNIIHAIIQGEFGKEHNLKICSFELWSTLKFKFHVTPSDRCPFFGHRHRNGFTASKQGIYSFFR